MKLENQVCSLELAKKLKELEVEQESLFYWRLGYHTSESFEKGISLGRVGVFRDYEIQYLPKPRLTTSEVKWNSSDLCKLDSTECSAFTVAELGEILKHYPLNYWYSYPDFRLQRDTEATSDARNENEADARAEMLVYLLENKIKPTN